MRSASGARRRLEEGTPNEERSAKAAASPHGLLALQSTAGNRAVAALISGGPTVQRALTSPRFASDPVLQGIDAGTGTLRRGSTGDPVRKVQHAVHDAGILFRGFGVDGYFERETERRVATYQRRKAVSGDSAGEVGVNTIRSLDALFPAAALPATAGDAYTFGEMKSILCQWNSAMVKDLKNLRVTMVAGLSWADERYDGSGWVADPMLGAGETAGTSITIATNDTNENVAKTLYHEYQHARAPQAYRSKSWADEETRVFELETYWAIDRGITPDPGLTTTDPATGDVSIDPAGVGSTVGDYPGVGGPTPGEVIGKVGANRVRVRLPDGRITVRAAAVDDTIPGPRTITPPANVVPAADWTC
jgi:hypothetical protein